MLTLRTYTSIVDPSVTIEPKIGVPRREGRDWYCECQVQGFDNNRIDRIYGVNTIQAVTLAIQYLRNKVYSIDDLKWRGGRNGERCIPYSIDSLGWSSISRRTIAYVEAEIRNRLRGADSQGQNVSLNAVVEVAEDLNEISKLLQAKTNGSESLNFLVKENFLVNPSKYVLTLAIGIPIATNEGWVCACGIASPRFSKCYKVSGLDSLHVIVQAISSLRALLVSTRATFRWRDIESEDAMLPYYIPMTCGDEFATQLATAVDEKSTECMTAHIQERKKRKAKRMRKLRRGY